MPHIKPETLWKSLGAAIFTINKKHYLCTVDYLSKLSIMKHMEVSSVDKMQIKTKTNKNMQDYFFRVWSAQ